MSNSWRVLLDLLMHNIDVPVDLTVSSTEVERPGPIQPFLYACEQLQVNPELCRDRRQPNWCGSGNCPDALWWVSVRRCVMSWVSGTATWSRLPRWIGVAFRVARAINRRWTWVRTLDKSTGVGQPRLRSTPTAVPDSTAVRTQRLRTEPLTRPPPHSGRDGIEDPQA